MHRLSPGFHAPRHSRESGNPVRGQRISKGLRSGFPLSRE
jgi:hypothetical protein